MEDWISLIVDDGSGEEIITVRKKDVKLITQKEVHGYVDYNEIRILVNNKEYLCKEPIETVMNNLL